MYRFSVSSISSVWVFLLVLGAGLSGSAWAGDFPFEGNKHQNKVSQEECVEAGDVFQEEIHNLDIVNLGAVEFTAALRPDDSTAYLNIVDCSGDGKLDVLIDWTDASAPVLAEMVVSPNLCSGNAPQRVSLLLQYENSCVLTGYDDTFSERDSATALPDSEPQWLTLSSPAGIRTILFEGSGICIQQVCWNCEIEFGDTPTPTITLTPTITPESKATSTSIPTPPQETSTPTPTNTPVLIPTVKPEHECIDFNGNKVIDFDDLLIFISEWHHVILED